MDPIYAHPVEIGNHEKVSEKEFAETLLLSNSVLLREINSIAANVQNDFISNPQESSTILPEDSDTGNTSSSKMSVALASNSAISFPPIHTFASLDREGSLQAISISIRSKEKDLSRHSDFPTKKIEKRVLTDEQLSGLQFECPFPSRRLMQTHAEKTVSSLGECVARVERESLFDSREKDLRSKPHSPSNVPGEDGTVLNPSKEIQLPSSPKKLHRRSACSDRASLPAALSRPASPPGTISSHVTSQRASASLPPTPACPPTPSRPVLSFRSPKLALEVERVRLQQCLLPGGVDSDPARSPPIARARFLWPPPSPTDGVSPEDPFGAREALRAELEDCRRRLRASGGARAESLSPALLPPSLQPPPLASYQGIGDVAERPRVADSASESEWSNDALGAVKPPSLCCDSGGGAAGLAAQLSRGGSAASSSAPAGAGVELVRLAAEVARLRELVECEQASRLLLSQEQPTAPEGNGAAAKRAELRLAAVAKLGRSSPGCGWLGALLQLRLRRDGPENRGLSLGCERPSLIARLIGDGVDADAELPPPPPVALARLRTAGRLLRQVAVAALATSLLLLPLGAFAPGAFPIWSVCPALLLLAAPLLQNRTDLAIARRAGPAMSAQKLRRPSRLFAGWSAVCGLLLTAAGVLAALGAATVAQLSGTPACPAVGALLSATESSQRLVACQALLLCAGGGPALAPCGALVALNASAALTALAAAVALPLSALWACRAFEIRLDEYYLAVTGQEAQDGGGLSTEVEHCHHRDEVEVDEALCNGRRRPEPEEGGGCRGDRGCRTLDPLCAADWAGVVGTTAPLAVLECYMAASEALRRLHVRAADSSHINDNGRAVRCASVGDTGAGAAV